jgi:hypothetical protein
MQPEHNSPRAMLGRGIFSMRWYPIKILLHHPVHISDPLIRRMIPGSVAYIPKVDESRIQWPTVLEIGWHCCHLCQSRGSIYALPASIPTEK